MSAPAVTIDGPLASIRFDRFDLDAYRLFLATKRLPESQVEFDPETETYQVTTPARFAPMLGTAVDASERPGLPLASHLFDYQQFAVQEALDGRRFALWLDTGLGKTAVFLEWARQVIHLTDGRVLIIERDLNVIRQVIDEAARWYGADLAIIPLRHRETVAAWCKEPGSGLAITNYEKFIPGIMPELRYLAGIVADESSVLRQGGGVIKWNLIKSARGVPWKLSCTATPAPNEVMEYASQAAFLEKLKTEHDILWTYFSRDKYGAWSVKPHAERAFYEFMASWSLYMRDPAHFGFADILSSLPAPVIQEYRLPLSDTQREMMIAFLVRRGRGMFTDDRMGVQERSKLSQMAKGFLYSGTGKSHMAARYESAKPGFVADLARQEMLAGRQCLIWTIFDEESDIIREHLADLPGLAVLHGSMTDTARADALDRFRAGSAPVLVSKASLIGYGLNLQFCRSMIFSGFDDSFERMYQAIRRCLRFGQTETVHVHVPYIPELEGMIFENVRAKERQFMDAVARCEAAYRVALKERLA